MIARRIVSRLLTVFTVSSAVTVIGLCGWASTPVSPAAAGLKAADVAAAAEELAKSFEPKVSSAVAFKNAHEDIERKAPVLAVLANAVAEADGDAPWKTRALAVRDAALALAKAKAQPPAEKAVKQIKELIAGGGSAAGDAKPAKPLDLIALEKLMKEVNDRNRDLNKSTKKFASSKESIARDAVVLSVLASAARQDTKSAEKAKKPQADFEKFADTLATSAAALAEAAKKGDQNAAKEAYGTVKGACSACHAVYRPDIE